MPVCKFKSLVSAAIAHVTVRLHPRVMPKKPLSPLQWVAVASLAGPPLVLVIFNIGPGRWINAAQDSVIGRHSLSLSFLAVLMLEFMLIGAAGIVVRWLTGRTLVALFTKKQPDK